MAIAPIAVFAQVNIAVEESDRLFSKGTQPSFLVEIPENKLKDVERDWMKYLNTNSAKGFKPETVNGEIIMRGAQNKNVSPAPFVVYSKLLETATGVRLTAWMSDNDSVFISKALGNDKDIAANKYVRDFAVQQYREVVKRELGREEDKLKKLESELKGLINDEDKSKKKINANDREIERNRRQIAINKSDEARKVEQINTQKTVVDNTRQAYGDTNKEAKKALADLEKERKKIEGSSEKLNKEIDNLQQQIRDEERNITQSQQSQREKTAEIEKQKTVISQVEAKLKGIN
jgi:predicted  nucleic acid-binding Zn-ribbon protein